VEELARLAGVMLSRCSLSEDELDNALDELQDAGLILYEHVAGFESLRKVKMNLAMKPSPRQMWRENKRRGLEFPEL